MKPKTLAMALALLVLVPRAAPARAADAPAPSSTGPSPQVQRWADRCTDFTTNGWAFKAPANFLPWLDVFSDPGVWLEFARRGLDPQAYVRTASSLLEPDMVKNYLEWTDPVIYEKWTRALAEPQFMTAVNATLFDPGKFMRWVMLPLDPKPWNILLTAVHPETWGKWLSAPLDPRTQALWAKAADPNTPLRLLEALQDPDNYPGLLVLEPASGSPERAAAPVTARY
jgi:hypothetical protein